MLAPSHDVVADHKHGAKKDTERVVSHVAGLHAPSSGRCRSAAAGQSVHGSIDDISLEVLLDAAVSKLDRAHQRQVVQLIDVVAVRT